MNKWLRRSHDWLLPRICVLCSGEAQTLDLCSRCVSALPQISTACQGCGVPMADASLCGRCLRQPSAFHRVCIPYRYEAPLNSLILGLKFHRRIETAAPLAALLLESIRTLPAPLPDVIVPVPLHTSRIRERGFNQALEIARPLARGLGLPVKSRFLKRHRSTAPQSSLPSSTARCRNVRGAFEVTRKLGNRVSHAAIVDDVVTTGATAGEAARVLKRAGIRRLELWCIARVAVD